MADLTGQTVVADAEVLRRWRNGPRWYHVVVAMIDDDDVEARRRAASSLLGAQLLRPSTPAQAHVTIWAAGFHPEGSLPASGSLPLVIGGARTFRSAAYLDVSGPGPARIRSRLLSDGLTEDRSGPFEPHVTVGIYLREVPMPQVYEALAQLRDAPPIPVTAQVRHMVVDTRSPQGRLVPI